MAILQRQDAQIFYECFGDSGPRILLIQGVGCIGRTWQPQVDGLKEHFRLLSYDNRGLGQSSDPRGSIDVDLLASDALALVDHEGWEKCHVVGHSLGGVVAQRLALSVPGRIQSLALMCTVGRGAEATALTARMIWLGLRSHLGTKDMRRRAFLDIIFPPEHAARMATEDGYSELEALFGRELASTSPMAMRQLKALRAHDTSSELHKLAQIPTLILSGRQDPIARTISVRRLAQLLPQAESHDFPDASHALPIQKPREVNALLEEFWRRHDS